ncbi:hypothetical protein JCM10908_007041 [Rhodotorula pacifica]|uniref:uncharacterized protein n=1 Tax=Rhodotorula pacifica TaxID=1495444 RepID=UPI00317D3641
MWSTSTFRQDSTDSFSCDDGLESAALSEGHSLTEGSAWRSASAFAAIDSSNPPRSTPIRIPAHSGLNHRTPSPFLGEGYRDGVDVLTSTGSTYSTESDWHRDLPGAGQIRAAACTRESPSRRGPVALLTRSLRQDLTDTGPTLSTAEVGGPCTLGTLLLIITLIPLCWLIQPAASDDMFVSPSRVERERPPSLRRPNSFHAEEISFSSPFASWRTSHKSLYPSGQTAPEHVTHIAAPRPRRAVASPSLLVEAGCRDSASSETKSLTPSITSSAYGTSATGLVASASSSSEASSPRWSPWQTVPTDSSQILPPFDTYAQSHSFATSRTMSAISPTFSEPSHWPEHHISYYERSSEHGPTRQSSHRATRSLDLGQPRRPRTSHGVEQRQHQSLQDGSRGTAPRLLPRPKSGLVFVNFSQADGKELMRAVRRANGCPVDP